MEALTGCIYPIILPNGKKIHLNIDKVVKPNNLMKVPNYGINYNNNRGDLIINFNIIFPNSLDNDTKVILKKQFNLPIKESENTVDIEYYDFSSSNTNLFSIIHIGKVTTQKKLKISIKNTSIIDLDISDIQETYENSIYKRVSN